MGKGSTPVHSRCCGNKYFILESNCILWPWAPHQTIDNTALMAVLPRWRVHTRMQNGHAHTRKGLWTVKCSYISNLCLCTNGLSSVFMQIRSHIQKKQNIRRQWKDWKHPVTSQRAERAQIPHETVFRYLYNLKEGPDFYNFIWLAFNSPSPPYEIQKRFTSTTS